MDVELVESRALAIEAGSDVCLCSCCVSEGVRASSEEFPSLIKMWYKSIGTFTFHFSLFSFSTLEQRQMLSGNRFFLYHTNFHSTRDL